ncbi:MAG: Rnase Y domain-containing protein [Pseudobdellovibrionaceae bacterium]
MSLVIILISIVVAALATFSIGYLMKLSLDNAIVKKAETEALEIVTETKEDALEKEQERKRRIEEISSQLWGKVEDDFLKIEESIESLESDLDSKRQKLQSVGQLKQNHVQKLEAEVQSYQNEIKSVQKTYNDRKLKTQETLHELVDLCLKKVGLSRDIFLTDITNSLIEEENRKLLKFVDDVEAETKITAEIKAKRILDIAIDRFARPYCPERGIGSVHFPEGQSRQILFDAKNENQKLLSELCGCDIILEEDTDLIGVAGFDPVRREHTRRVLEKLLKEKRPVSKDFIKKTVDLQKKELFRQIKQDGDNIARELGQDGMHPEIRQMMGSLRYRYSFTQNQYFHCGEVGWLCGLLASELKLEIKKARRSGLLHDIGKSMDHAMEGGHAVIGADFISARGENAEVVHNVRAHHFDEQPNTDHAFLVIAADAISGARPGARRSTIETYNQKVADLQDIAFSFPGVIDCIILAGGRECRVNVNSRQVDDRKSLELSKMISKKIEDDMSYPGQIKVVVVRETVVSEMTKNNSIHA